jgi:hypothetical protein
LSGTADRSPRPDEGAQRFVIFAGDPLRKTGRLTEFDDAAAAMTFCEPVSPLADWRTRTLSIAGIMRMTDDAIRSFRQTRFGERI